MNEPIPNPNKKNDPDKDEDLNILSGDNKVDVEIEPDVKANGLTLQICSCSLIFNCFTGRNSERK